MRTTDSQAIASAVKPATSRHWVRVSAKQKGAANRVTRVAGSPDGLSNEIAENARRIAAHARSRRHILGDHRAGGHHGPGPDAHPWAHHHGTAKPRVIANRDGQPYL